MGIPLNVLIIEDSEDDTLLIVRELRQAGYEPRYERVETAEAMKAALDNQLWNIIISDYVMPKFSGLAALKLMQDKGLDLPFIIVTGNINENMAVEAMKAGADDYVMKGNLSRLNPAVQRELREAEGRKRRRQAEEALYESRRNLEAIVETVPTLIVLTDPDGRIILFNHACEELTGYKSEEVLGKTIEELFLPPGWIPVVQKRFADPYAPEVRAPHENPWLKKSGEERLIEWQCTVISSPKDGRPCILGTGIDITDRKSTEEKLRQTEERYRTVVEDIPALICRFLPDGTLTFVNEAYCRYCNKTREELEGFNFFQFIPEEERQKVKDYYSYLTPTHPITHYENKVVTPDGMIRWQRWTDRALFNKDGFPVEYQSIGEDITDLKRAEETRARLEAQLLQAQKMEAIGQLAGGIAHDFNNILTAIMGYVHFLKVSIADDDPARTFIVQIQAAAERAANLTQSLLAFSRKQIINLRPVKLNEIIRNIQKLLLRIMGEDIELKTMLTDKDLTVMADTGQIEQVLMNLATNARDAMPEGGLLRIETEVLELDEEFVMTHGYGKKGMYALVTVTDTGIGMDEATRERVFEPFFTTKEFGKGTGLGLSIVYGIIKQHEGYINAYSEPGRGTTFKIYLPLITSEAEKEPSEVVHPLTGGTETILLAEDDEGVRVFTKALLQKFGYTLIEAVDGEDAIHKFKENYDSIQLLLVDVIMPKKNGKEVFDEIRKVKADMRVLFMSGYTADIIHKKGIVEDGLDFVLKPVSPQELLRKVREVLDR